MIRAHEQEHMSRLVQLLKQLPPPPAAPLLVPELEKVTCACGKSVCLSKVCTFSTPFVRTATSNVCRGCKRPEAVNADAGKARMVCIGCGRMVMRMPPHVNKDTGKSFLPGKTYHVLGCPACPVHLRKKIAEILNSGISVEDGPNQKIEFASPIFEVMYVTDPTHAIQCLSQILAPPALNLPTR